jgi:hypothetical protein
VVPGCQSGRELACTTTPERRACKQKTKEPSLGALQARPLEGVATGELRRWKEGEVPPRQVSPMDTRCK